MQGKPSEASGYDREQLNACRRLLLEFCRGLGPWKDAVYLVGGLAPSIRDPEPHGNVQPHIGTLDIDLFLDTSVLGRVEAYSSLKQNIKRMGLVRGHNLDGQTQHYRWERRDVDGRVVSIDLLCDQPGRSPATAVTLPGESGLSALVIPASSLVIHDHVDRTVVVEDRQNDVVLEEDIHVAGIAASIVLKSYAFEARRIGKDAYDIVWSLSANPGGPEAAAREFLDQMRAQPAGNHHHTAIGQLRRRFTGDAGVRAVQREGPVEYALFLSEEQRGSENQRRRQEAVVIVGQFLREFDRAMGSSTDASAPCSEDSR